MARCLYDVLLYSDDDDGTMHADVAKVIARLIAESVDALEKIIRRFKAGEFGPPRNKPSCVRIPVQVDRRFRLNVTGRSDRT